MRSIGLGGGTRYFNWVTFGIAGVPEPASWDLLITGFGLRGAMVRRRRLITRSQDTGK